MMTEEQECFIFKDEVPISILEGVYFHSGIGSCANSNFELYGCPRTFYWILPSY